MVAVFQVQELRRLYNNTVLVDAGDQYQGTMWFYKYGGNITAHFMNRIGYEVMVSTSLLLRLTELSGKELSMSVANQPPYPPLPSPQPFPIQSIPSAFS